MGGGIVMFLLGILGVVTIGPTLIAGIRGMSGGAVLSLFFYGFLNFIFFLAIGMMMRDLSGSNGGAIALVLVFHPFLFAFAPIDKDKSSSPYSKEVQAELNSEIMEKNPTSAGLADGHAVLYSNADHWQRRHQQVPGLFYLAMVLLVLFGGFHVVRFYLKYQWEKRYEHATEVCDKHAGLTGKYPVLTEGVLDSRKGRDNPLQKSLKYFSLGHSFVEYRFSSISFDYRTKLIKNEGEMAYREKNVYLKPGVTGPTNKNRKHFVYPEGRDQYNYNYYNYYRVYASQNGDPLCAFYDLIDVKRKPRYEQAAGLAKDQCLAMKGFDEKEQLLSKYEIAQSQRAINDVEFQSIDLIERENSELVARYNFLFGSQANSYVRCPVEYDESPDSAIRNLEQNLFGHAGEDQL